MDKDGDGQVDLKEFMQFLGREWNGSSVLQARLRAALLRAEAKGLDVEDSFGAMDEDGSGELSLKALERALSELGVLQAMPKQEVDRLLRALDTDGSGSVGLKELMAFVGRRYSGELASERKLKAILHKAEGLGTSVAEVFSHFDKDGSGSVSLEELDTALKDLGVFDALPTSEVRKLMARFDPLGTGSVGLRSFMELMGVEYSPTAVAEARLKKVLLRAEEQGGASLEASFGVFDKDKSGKLTAAELQECLTSLGVLKEEDISAQQVQLVLRRFDTDGDGFVSLREFLCFMGRPYTATDSPLERKLRLVLLKAEELGTPLEECFKHFDKDGDGYMDVEELRQGLHKLKVFEAFDGEEVQAVLKHFDLSGDGSVSLSEFMRFMGRDYKVDVGSKLRRTLLKVEQMGTSLEEAFETLDTNGDGLVTAPELLKAIGDIGTFQGVTLRDATDFVRLFGGGGEGSEGVSWADILTFVRTPEATLKARQRKRAQAAYDKARTPSRGGRRGAGSQGVLEVLERFRMQLREEGGGGSKGKGRGKARMVFESFDADESGKLSVTEFEQALRCLGVQVGAEEVTQVVDHMDTDGDGQVSLHELLQWCEQGEEEGKEEGKEGGGGRTRRERWGREEGREEEEEYEEEEEDDEVDNLVREVVLQAEARGAAMESVFAHFDTDGDGRITVKEMFRGLEDLGVFEHGKITKDDIIDLVDRFDRDRSGDVSVVEFIRFVRNKRQRGRRGGGGWGGDSGRGSGSDSDVIEEGKYVFSTDPDTKDMERKLQRVVGRQARRGGVDVEKLFHRYDANHSGEVVRSDFAQVMMELGLSLIEGGKGEGQWAKGMGGGGGGSDPATLQRQLAQLARTKGPVDRRLLRMRHQNRGLFGMRQQRGAQGGAHSDDDARGHGGGACAGGMESLALIQWYREGQKKELVKRVLSASLTTEYRLFFSFATPLFFEHPFRNPFNHEERFRIDVEDPELRLVVQSEEWMHLRRHVRPCVGSIGDCPVEADMLDVDPREGVQITLLANECVYLPFSFLSLVPRRTNTNANTNAGAVATCTVEPRKRGGGRAAPGQGRDEIDGDQVGEQVGQGSIPERCVCVSIRSASHGHVVNLVQVELHRRPFVTDRTLRFFQAEGEVLKRAIRLLEGRGRGRGAGLTGSRAEQHARARTGPTYEDMFGAAGGVGGGQGPKFVHCVEDGGMGSGKGNVVVEWRQRPQAGGGGVAVGGPGGEQEVLIKSRVGPFPAQQSFYVLLYNDHHQSSLYETWLVVVQSRLRLDVHSPVGQSSPVDLVVRGDRYTRRVRCFSSHPRDVSFQPNAEFQLVPGAYNRVEMRFKPRQAGGAEAAVSHAGDGHDRGGAAALVPPTAAGGGGGGGGGVYAQKIQVHMVDLDSRELVGAWLATATTTLPTVTKAYDIDLPLGQQTHKRIAYTNPWGARRSFKLLSSHPELMQPRYETVDIEGKGTGYFRLWLHAPAQPGQHREAYLFVNDENDKNEETLLVRMRAVLP